jgi:hypothetical protein
VTLDVGISFDGFSTSGESLDTAREAEAAGASSFWMADTAGIAIRSPCRAVRRVLQVGPRAGR